MTDAGGDSNAGRDGGATGTCSVIFCSYFSALLFSSSHSSSFPIVSFSVDGGDNNAGRAGGQEGGSVRWAGCLGAWWQVRRTGRRLKEVGQAGGQRSGGEQGT